MVTCQDLADATKTFHLYDVSFRMPGERLMVRDLSEVGRYPGTAPPTRVELTIHKEDEKKQEVGGCRRWLRKICPCCCKRQNSNSYDVTDKVELVKPPTPTPAPSTAPEAPKPKPENGEAREMEGNDSKLAQKKIKMTALREGSKMKPTYIFLLLC